MLRSTQVLRLIAGVVALGACHRATPPAACHADLECSDGRPCNGVERCVQGKCVPGAPPSCDDGVLCTVDGCDDSRGCVHTLDDASCEDGIACTDDSCSLQGCAHVPVNARCDDGLFCNGAERCDPSAGCSPGTPPLDCIPARACETAHCDEATHACVTVPIDADGDGHGAAPCGDDCDDSDPKVHPGAPEVCNDRDDNCDGWVDEVRVVGQRIDISANGGAESSYSAVGLLGNPDGSWTLSWPDYDCVSIADASVPSFAIEDRAPDGTALPGVMREWYAFPGRSWRYWGPSLARLPGGSLLSAVSILGPGTGNPEAWLTGRSSTGSLVSAQYLGSPFPPIDRTMLASDGSEYLLVYIAETSPGAYERYAVPLDAAGGRAGPDVDVGPAGVLDVMNWKLAFDPTSGHFLHVYALSAPGGIETHALLMDSTGAIVADRVLPIPATAGNPHLVGTGSGYVAAWRGLPGGYVMALGPGFEPGPATLLSPGTVTYIVGMEVRSHEVAIAWEGQQYQITVSLVGFDAVRRAPDIELVPPMEWESSKVAFQAGGDRFGILYNLRQGSPAGACASQPADPHGRYAFRTLACP